MAAQTESDIIFSKMTPEEQGRAWQIFTDLSNGKITPAQANEAQAVNERRVRSLLAAGPSTPIVSTPAPTTTPIATTPQTESDIIFSKMTPEEQGRAWEIFTDLSTQKITPEQASQQQAANEKRVREELAAAPTNTPISPATATPSVPTAPETLLESQVRREQRESSKAIINNLLNEYGLSNLTNFVNEIITQEDIISGDVILGRIRQTEQYKQRFVGNARRRAAGFNALSEAEYVNLENTFRQVMRSSGLPQTFYDQPEDFAELISKDVSVAELSSRINDGYQAVRQANPQVLSEMRRLYGVDDGALAAYFLDPEKATPILLRQAQAAQIGAQAQEQAQMALTAQQAEQLAIAGVSEAQARQGFQAIQESQQLFVPLPGTTEQAVTAEEQVAGVFGTQAAAQQRIRQRQRERTATFQGGGGFAGQGSTVTGLQ